MYSGNLGAGPGATLEVAILGFIIPRPVHGYAIHQELSDPTGLGPVWQVKLSHLYAILGRLENQGYLRTTLEPQEGKPPRKVFHLTADGTAVFRQWMESPVRNGRSLRLEFLVKLYFARREGSKAVRRLLDAQRTRCREWLDTEEEIAGEEASRGRQYGQLVHEFRYGQIQAIVEWLNQCERENRSDT